jgi:menaquinone-dependent protoporphyrinogen IX oxidase
MAERLPWESVDLYPVEKAPEPKGYELVLLGGGVYNEDVSKEIVEYAMKHLAFLKDQKIVLFAVCLDTKGVYMSGKIHGGWEYLNPLLDLFKDQLPVHAGILSGEINPKKLTEKDYKLLMAFYNKILKRNLTEVPYRTMMNKSEVWEFVEKVLARLEGGF